LLEYIFELFLLIYFGKSLTIKKNGKEHNFFPTVEKEDYLKFESGDFMERFHVNSFVSLVATL